MVQPVGLTSSGLSARADVALPSRVPTGTFAEAIQAAIELARTSGPKSPPPAVTDSWPTGTFAEAIRAAIELARTSGEEGAASSTAVKQVAPPALPDAPPWTLATPRTEAEGLGALSALAAKTSPGAMRDAAGSAEPVPAARTESSGSPEPSASLVEFMAWAAERHGAAAGTLANMYRRLGNADPALVEHVYAMAREMTELGLPASTIAPVLERLAVPGTTATTTLVEILDQAASHGAAPPALVNVARALTRSQPALAPLVDALDTLAASGASASGLAHAVRAALDAAVDQDARTEFVEALEALGASPEVVANVETWLDELAQAGPLAMIPLPATADPTALDLDDTLARFSEAGARPRALADVAEALASGRPYGDVLARVLRELVAAGAGSGTLVNASRILAQSPPERLADALEAAADSGAGAGALMNLLRTVAPDLPGRWQLETIAEFALRDGATPTGLARMIGQLARAQSAPELGDAVRQQLLAAGASRTLMIVLDEYLAEHVST